MRGKSAPNLRGEAQKLAQEMGYHWAENTDPSVPFDGFLYRDTILSAIKLKKLRYGLEADCIIEQKLPDDVAGLRSLPLPPYVVRELWVRTQNERAYRRFYILPDCTAEIEENTRENYRNTHYREAYWKKAPYRVEYPSVRMGRGGMKSDKPVKRSFCQKDEGHFRLEWKRCPRP